MVIIISTCLMVGTMALSARMNGRDISANPGEVEQKTLTGQQ
jgi:hypothetical protein